MKFWEVIDFSEVVEYLKGVNEEVSKVVKESIEYLNKEIVIKENELLEVFESLFLMKIMFEEY